MKKHITGSYKFYQRKANMKKPSPTRFLSSSQIHKYTNLKIKSQNSIKNHWD